MKILIHRAETDRTLDMTPDGAFRDPPTAPWAERILRGAVMVGIIAGMLGLAALALWFALLLIPLAALAGLIGYAAWRWRLWRAG
jgi:hypothetical protein